MNETDKTTLLNMVKDRPQSLCRKCGNCCKVATTKDSYKELLEKKVNGDKAAIDFLEIFEPYDSVEDAKKVAPDVVENILKHYGQSETITFYKCKHIQKNNKCGIYKNRPFLCQLNPLSAWSVVPPSCGFKQWLEIQKTRRIAEIKEQKYTVEELKTLKKMVKDPNLIDEIEKRIIKCQEIIDYYEKYGSKDW